MHAPSEEKSDDSKDSFREELEQMVNHFRKYHTKILMQNWGEEIFKPTHVRVCVCVYIYIYIEL